MSPLQVSRNSAQGESGAVVDYLDLVVIWKFPGAYYDKAVQLVLFSYSIGYSIFHQWLQCKGGQVEICGLKVVFYIQLVAETELLKFYIFLGMFQLF